MYQGHPTSAPSFLDIEDHLVSIPFYQGQLHLILRCDIVDGSLFNILQLQKEMILLIQYSFQLQGRLDLWKVQPRYDEKYFFLLFFFEIEDNHDSSIINFGLASF